MKRAVILLLVLAIPAFAGREFLSSSTEFGAKATSITTYPVTVSCWFFPYSTNANQVLAFFGDSGATQRRFLLYYTTGRVLTVDSIADGGGAFSASTTTTAATNAWHHALAIWDSSTSRRVYLNGSGASTNTSAATTTGLSTFAIGARNNLGSWGVSWNGLIAEVAVWNVALTPGELVALNSGASPLTVRPASLVHYVPLTGQDSANDWDLCGTQLGLTNSPAPSAYHPRIYNP